MTLPRAFLERPIAHRALHDGNHARVENGLNAIEAAVAQNFGIEVDLQLSADAHAMVFHDYTLDRLTNQGGNIRDFTASELSSVQFKTGEIGVPTLKRALACINGRVPLLLELKDQHGQMGETDGTLERAVARALQGYTGPVAVMSFNPHMVAKMAELCPQIPRGITSRFFSTDAWPDFSEETCAHLNEIPDYDRVGAAFISHNWQELDHPRVAKLKAKGAHIFCWTVKSAADEIKAREIADNVTFELYDPA